MSELLNILQITSISFLKVLPILILAIVLSQVVNKYMPKNKIEEKFIENEKNIIKTSMIGIATPGPLLAFLPLLKTLKEKGMAVSLIVTFITGQTLIGPMRLLLEVDYFGIQFFIYRVVLALFMAITIGNIFKFLEKYIKF